MLCDVMKEHTADILIPHERIITLVFLPQRRLVGDISFPMKFALKMTHPLWKTPTLTDTAYNVWIIKASEKCSTVANRKSITRFPTSYRWNAYVTPNSPKCGPESVSFLWIKFKFNRIKLFHKVSLCENFQQQSCSRTIRLSNGV